MGINSKAMLCYVWFQLTSFAKILYVFITHTCINGDAFVGDPICEPGEEAASGLIVCTGFDNKAARVISLVESALDLMGPAGDATEDVEGEVPSRTNLSSSDPPPGADPLTPTLAVLGSTSALSNAWRLGAESLALLLPSLIDLTKFGWFCAVTETRKRMFWLSSRIQLRK